MSGPVSYETSGRKATITLDRPERYNAIDDDMPGALRAAVERADDDDDIHVIVVTGADEAFCSGYDLKHYAEEPRPPMGSQAMPRDPMHDYRMMHSNTADFMSLWRS